MKTQKIVLALAMIMIGYATAWSQEKAVVWSWDFIKAEKGKSAELEKAIKDKTEKFNKASVDPIQTWRVMSGPRAGMLVRVVPGRDWSYYEKESEGLKYWNQTVTPFIASNNGREFGIFKKDMSYSANPDVNTIPKFIDVSEFIVRSDKEYAFTSFVMEVTKMAKENKSKINYTTYQVTSGNNGTKYVVVWGYQSLMEKDANSENWPEWYNKMRGSSEAWIKDIGAINESIEIYGSMSYLCAYVPELSSK